MRVVLSLLVVLALAGCHAPTSVTQIWRAPVATPVHKVIVFGARVDEAHRRALEDAFVAELANHAVEATPSYQVFPGNPPEHTEAQKVVAEKGYDGILVATLKRVEESQRFVPGHTTFWSSYYGPAWGYAYSTPGYLVTDRTVVCETTLWDARAESALQWAGSTETENPGGGGDFARSLARAVAKRLAQGGFLAP